MAKKIKKPTEIQKESIEVIKEYLNDYVYRNSDAYSVDFQDKSTKSDVHLHSVITYKNFNAIIKFEGSFFLQENNLDVVFNYENCDYNFSIYNIFNLFDIDDFNCYFYQNCLGRDSVINALDNLTGIIEKYFREIQNAGNQTYLPTLINQYENDQLTANGEDWKEELEDPSGIDLTHIFFLTNTAKNKQKLIKKLEKYDSKGKLILYEKRLLSYLKAGNDLVDVETHSDKCDKIVTKLKIKVYSVISILTILAYFIFEVVTLNIYFGKGYVPTDEFTYVGNYDMGFYISSNFIFVVLSIAFMTLVIIHLFGIKIVYRLCPDNVKDYFITNEKKDLGNKKVERILNKYVAPVVIFIISAFLLLLANTGISFTEDGIRYHSVPFSVVEKSYEDIEIYQCKQYYDEDEDAYFDYEDICYVIAWDDDYYVMTACPELSETDKYIKDLATEHNKEINQIENEEVLAEVYFE